VDYHNQDFIETIRQAEPNGLDFVFEGIGGEQSDRVLSLVRQGGKVVAYAAPAGILPMLKDAFQRMKVNLLSKGVRAEFYGITALYLWNKNPFMEDLPKLFKLLEEGKIKPMIAARFPLLEARKANELLESGAVTGNLVLLSSELL
jgi:NADPH:quinone reductase-like Zn-dependent oxidoreductase